MYLQCTLIILSSVLFGTSFTSFSLGYEFGLQRVRDLAIRSPCFNPLSKSNFNVALVSVVKTIQSTIMRNQIIKHKRKCTATNLLKPGRFWNLLHGVSKLVRLYLENEMIDSSSKTEHDLNE